MPSLYVRRLSVRPTEAMDAYLTEIPAVQALTRESLELTSPVAILVGENGTGKTTLLEALALACGFQAEGGSRHFNARQTRSGSNLADHLILGRSPARPRDGFYLKAENFYQTISYVDELEREDSTDYAAYGGKSLHERSHGEGFLELIQNRFVGHGLYLLDEPEAALSPMRQLTLLVEMKRLQDAGSQIILATHSPMLMAYPGAQVLLLDEAGIRSVDYRDTEHYQTTKLFLDNPEQMLHYLLRD